MESSDLYHREIVTLITADGVGNETGAVLLREHELGVSVNEQYVMSLVCTDQYLEELVMGRLLTDGFIESAEDVSAILFNNNKTEVSVILNNDITVRERRPLRALPKPDYKIEWIFSMAERFAKGTDLHDMTACAHSCILSRKGEILFICEDIGRHNALDKAVGYALGSGIPLSECILYTSGRVPVDMAKKPIAAGIPVLASKSLPTAEALDLAKEYGLLIIGNARPDSVKIFSEKNSFF
ncbi:MAG: formate dehydrogenase accessory sulfurtransferase FdhD [Lachnospiraceae bacterium]|nr:formate dehydrogenase accessory sulfurtransferase FdhD [Lachnospiraceae bacterium]